jgi:glutamate synthase (NADPH/NADH) large chain
MQAFGYTIETMQFMLLPLVRELREPIGSMGNDSCLACLSDKPRMLYDYFRQLFAQVTNPAIDSIREEVICRGVLHRPRQNLLETTPARRRLQSRTRSSNEQLAAPGTWICGAGRPSHRHHLVAGEGKAGLEKHSIDVPKQSWPRIKVFRSSLVGCVRPTAPVSRLPRERCITTLRRTKRTRIGIVVETGEAAKVHHHCLLVGFADAINRIWRLKPTLRRRALLGPKAA